MSLIFSLATVDLNLLGQATRLKDYKASSSNSSSATIHYVTTLAFLAKDASFYWC